ncbi:hypothetical protein BH11PLA2_BH11PLA2_28050 [soil metagenome]
MNRRRFLVLAAGTIPVLGCGSKTGSLKGAVTYLGKPVVIGIVTATGEGGVAPVGAEIQPDGTYLIAEMPTGTYLLSVVSPDPEEQARLASKLRESGRKPANAPATTTPKPVPGWIELPARFANPDTADFKVEVNGPTEFNIAMKST